MRLRLDETGSPSKYSVRDGPTWTRGDVREVDDETGEHLLRKRYFYRVDYDAAGEDPPDDASDANAGDDSDAVPDEHCTTVKSDGDVCGRDRPCPYHDD